MEKITIHVIDGEEQPHKIITDINTNLTLMEVVRDAGFTMGNCGGMALCASCHCYINSEIKVNSKTVEEEDMLNQLYNSEKKSRLICQIPIDETIDCIVIQIVKD